MLVWPLERVSRQYQILGNPDSVQLLQQDLLALQATLKDMQELARQADAHALATSIGTTAEQIVNTTTEADVGSSEALAAIAEFPELADRVRQLIQTINSYIEEQLNQLRESARQATRISAWQTAALLPGTIFIILIFTVLVARPIRQIDRAITQLGDSGFSKPIEIHGPSDLEALGRQLEWLRVRLLDLAQEKNRFLRHMSHELKTPLANIREGSELLLDQTVGQLQPSQREVAGIIRNNGIKLQQLIENLLSFSAWQTKNEQLTRSDFPLRALVISAAKSQQLALKTARIKVQLEVEDIIINADRDKIRTVFENLLSNAIKFMPRGGRITIRAKAEAHSVHIDFADTGPGIPLEERSRIFDAFFQGHQRQGGHIAGTGIGLSIVKECIQAHEGQVELLDSTEFSGAHFRMQIPQAKAPVMNKTIANG